VKHRERRREIGKMLVKIAEYLLTIALIGRILIDKVTMNMAVGIVATALIILIIAFFTLPPDE